MNSNAPKMEEKKNRRNQVELMVTTLDQIFAAFYRTFSFLLCVWWDHSQKFIKRWVKPRKFPWHKCTQNKHANTQRKREKKFTHFFLFFTPCCAFINNGKTKFKNFEHWTSLCYWHTISIKLNKLKRKNQQHYV